MVMLIAGGSLSTGSHDPYCGTLMPLGPSTPSVGVKHKPRTNRRFLSILRGSAQQENPPVAVGDIFIRKTADSDRLLEPRVDAGVKELNEMTIGRTDDPGNPLGAKACEAAFMFGTGSRIPSGPAVMAPRQQAGHMIAIDPPVRFLIFSLAPK